VVNTNGLGDLDTPKGVAIDRTWNLYISDTNNSRIGKITNSGGSFTVNMGKGNGMPSSDMTGAERSSCA
jgi:hypothetical protein